MLWGVPFSSGIGYRKGQGRRQVKQSGVDSMGGVWGGVSPPKLEDSVWGYNLKLISTLHNDSIPQTPSRKSGVNVSTPVHPVATPLDLTKAYILNRKNWKLSQDQRRLSDKLLD